MPNHACDRGAVRLDPGASRSQAYQPDADVAGRMTVNLQAVRLVFDVDRAAGTAPVVPGVNAGPVMLRGTARYRLGRTAIAVLPAARRPGPAACGAGSRQGRTADEEAGI